MADRINNFDPNAGVYRVHEAPDTLKEGKKNQEEEEQGESEKDTFNKLSEKTDWHVLFEQQHLWKKNTEIALEDVTSIKFLGINLKTDPSLLQIRIAMNDGTVISQAFLPISRTLGFRFKNLSQLSEIPVRQITAGHVLRVTIPVDEAKLDEEITRITRGQRSAKEATFSQRLKNFIQRKTFIQKIGVQDPVSKTVNNEIVVVYATVFVVIAAIIFTVYILFHD